MFSSVEHHPVGGTSTIIRRQSYSRPTDPLALTLLLPIFPNASWALVSGAVLYRGPSGLSSTALHVDCLWFSVRSHSVLNMFTWWGKRTTLICGYKNRYVGCNYGLCWFNRVVVVGSFIRSRISAILSSWLDFQCQVLYLSCWMCLQYN